MKASDVMRTSVVTVTPDTRLLAVARLLLETNQRALPVIDRRAGHRAAAELPGRALAQDEGSGRAKPFAAWPP